MLGLGFRVRVDVRVVRLRLVLVLVLGLPYLHAQVKVPGVLVQSAYAWQSLFPLVHSFLSLQVLPSP